MPGRAALSGPSRSSHAARPTSFGPLSEQLLVDLGQRGERKLTHEVDAARGVEAVELLPHQSAQLIGADIGAGTVTTKACTASPQSASGTPITAAARTCG